MSNKELKAQRVKGIFIETTKNIIIEHGVDAVSARKVADIAGYTFATIYNHFSNMDELLFETRAKVIAEIISFLHNKVTEGNKQDAVYTIFKNYIDYFIEHPNYFQFLFYKKLDNEHGDFEANNEYMLLGQILIEAIDDTDTSDCNTVFFAVHGMLMIYISQNFGMTKEQLYQYLDKLTNHFDTEAR